MTSLNVLSDKYFVVSFCISSNYHALCAFSKNVHSGLHLYIMFAFGVQKNWNSSTLTLYRYTQSVNVGREIDDWVSTELSNLLAMASIDEGEDQTSDFIDDNQGKTNPYLCQAWI